MGQEQSCCSGRRLAAARKALVIPGLFGTDEPIAAGAEVELHGLSAKAWNGLKGQVQYFDEKAERYSVRMEDGSVKLLKGDNLKPTGKQLSAPILPPPPEDRTVVSEALRSAREQAAKKPAEKQEAVPEVEDSGTMDISSWVDAGVSWLMKPGADTEGADKKAA
mmetsp:Transcript_11863/g.26994  ORF Transcript_11863/g.26994 Transcript_11863/m.26994 type:complete len:164 (+) Transcript_11863:34-525(+)